VWPERRWTEKIKFFCFFLFKKRRFFLAFSDKGVFPGAVVALPAQKCHAGGTMRLSCPNCSIEYDVPDSALGGRGRRLRCSACAHEWRVGSPEPVPAPVPESEPAGSAAVMEAQAEPEVAPLSAPDRFEALVRETRQREAEAAPAARRSRVRLVVLLLVMVLVVAFVLVERGH
jgi:predicted Zn finger-like uncharacterized protein